MKAIARNIRISPKKANLIAGLVRNKNAAHALDVLKFTPKKGAKILFKVLHSAIANAENNFKQNKDSLMVQEIIVTEGPTMKRSVPVSRGRVHPILKRTSHITVKVGVAESETKAVAKAKAEPKAKKAAPKKEESKKTTT